MQALKITIPGEYWDSQIDTGKLYLFESDSNSIRTVDWKRFILDQCTNRADKFILAAAFLRGNILQDDIFQLMLSDESVADSVRGMFSIFSERQLELSTEAVPEYTISNIPNNFPIPHNDSSIIDEKLYICSDSGVYYSSLGRGPKKGLSTRIYQLNDIPGLNISIRWPLFALSRGADGLFIGELRKPGYPNEKFPMALSGIHCSSANWLEKGIITSSHIENCNILSVDETVLHRHVFSRNEDSFIRGVYKGSEYLRWKAYCWGLYDRIYQVTRGDLTQYLVKFDVDGRPLVTHSASHEIQVAGQEVVSGGVSSFGTVIEFDELLYVLTSDGQVVKFEGEPVNWRIFPMTNHYHNQLHIAYEDRLEIIAFYHDFFVDQDENKIGMVWRDTDDDIDVVKSADQRARYSAANRL